MALIDDLLDDNSFVKAQSHYCGVCTLVANLSEKEAHLIQQRFDDDKISHMALSKVLKANGYNISDGVVGRHRREECSGVARK